MKIIRSKSFTAERAWGALDIANMNGITTRLHWTDQPYKWHVNDGQEVFVVLDGQVQMRYREEGIEKAGAAGRRRYLLCVCRHRACGASAGRGADSGDRIGRQCLRLYLQNR